MANPDPSWPSDSTITALHGTSDATTQMPYISPGTNPSSSPTLAVQETRKEHRLNKILAALMTGLVWDEGSLKIGVSPGEYTLGGTVKTFAGATAQSVADDDTNYVYVNSSNALVINTTGFPGDLTTFLPLAEVVAASGAITITDKRLDTLFTVSNSSGTFASQALDNLASVAINTALISDTDNTDDLGSTAVAWKNAHLAGSLLYAGAARTYFTTLSATEPTANRLVTIPDFGGDDTLVALAATQTLTNKTLTGAVISSAGITFDQATDDITVVAADPAAARTYTIPEVGAVASFVMTVGAQTLAGKTLTTPTVGDLSNMLHTHANAAGGGALTQTSHGTGKYCPVMLPFYLSGAMTVKVFEIEAVATFDFTLRDVRGRANTAPVGADLIMDIRVNGASIFSNQSEMVVIADGTNGDTSATKDHAVSAGDILTFECEQIGSGTAGSDVTLTLNCLAALDAA